jgi:hypothetical protein
MNPDRWLHDMRMLLAIVLVIALVVLVLSCAPKGHRQQPLKTPDAYRAEVR